MYLRNQLCYNCNLHLQTSTEHIQKIQQQQQLFLLYQIMIKPLVNEIISKSKNFPFLCVNICTKRVHITSLLMEIENLHQKNSLKSNFGMDITHPG